MNHQARIDSFWETRRLSLTALDNSCRKQRELIYEAFFILQDSINAFDTLHKGHEIAHHYRLAATKGWNYAVGTFTLVLDGVSQEAGALVRPWLEAIEMLVYLRTVSTALAEAQDGRLPSAGQRARVVAGRFKDARYHLSKHSCHLSMEDPAVDHLVDVSSPLFRMRLTDRYDETAFVGNLKAVFVFTISLSSEVILCLASLKSKPTTAGVLHERVGRCVMKGRDVFGLDVVRDE